MNNYPTRTDFEHIILIRMYTNHLHNANREKEIKKKLKPLNCLCCRSVSKPNGLLCTMTVDVFKLKRTNTHTQIQTQWHLTKNPNQQVPYAALSQAERRRSLSMCKQQFIYFTLFFSFECAVYCSIINIWSKEERETKK